jgi:myo-inositol-1-phosphate synthase
MKVGALIIGIHGASASTFVAGYLKYRNDKSMFCKGSYWCSEVKDFPIAIYNMVLGGWDYRFENLDDAIKHNNLINYEFDSTLIEYYPPIIGPTDYAVLEEGKKITFLTLEDAVETVRRNIRDFRLKYNLDKVIVINSSSPKYCEQALETEWSSNQAYSLGTVLEGADWVEFTPSDSITPELIELAKKSRSRLAGRDGSTGQTILKIYLRDYFHSRGFEINSWYSTNLIGNHDGEVLRHSKFNQTKLQDKLNVLPESIIEKENHIVEIQYVPPAGDNKESWDCIHITGWLDSKMSMRINWHGKDSFLAAPLMLDIIAGLINAEDNKFPYGLISPLGIFFKNPIGQLNVSYEKLLTNFRDFAAVTNK